MITNKNENASPAAEQALGKKERIAIIAGFVLIGCVFVFTLLRSIHPGDTSSQKSVGTKSANQVNPDYATISSKDLEQQIQQKDKITLLDIRSFDDYIAQHIIDSVNVPAGDISNSDKITPANPFVIIGTDENDANINTAITALKDKHATDIKVLAGGITAWEANGQQTVSFGDPTSFVDQAKVFYATPQQAHDMIQNNPNNTIVLDVRDPSDFSKGHVANAINIPLLNLEQRRNEIPPLKKVLIFGVTDVAEFQAGVQLYDLTQTMAYVVKGGMQAWQDAKFPTAQ